MAGLCPDLLGCLNTPPGPLVAMRGPTSRGGGKGGIEKEGNGKALRLQQFSIYTPACTPLKEKNHDEPEKQ